MKSKAFIYIIVGVCLVAWLAGCSSVGCSEHCDANGDLVCDICKQDLGETSNGEETEIRVPMTVNPVPADVCLSDFVSIKFEGDYMSGAEAVGGVEYKLFNNYSVCPDIEVRYAAQDAEGEGRYILLNKRSCKIIKDDILTSAENTVTILFHKTHFEVRELWENEARFENYTYSGTLIGNAHTWTSDDGLLQQFIYDNVYLSEVRDVYTAGVTYLRDAHGGVFALDRASGEVIYRTSIEELSAHSDARCISGGVGYVLDGGNIYAYDIELWDSSIMTYELPHDAEDIKLFALSDGDLLIQAVRPLLYNAVSYDFLSDGNKYDLIYIIIDISERSAEETEFGYYVNSAAALDRRCGYTDAAKNLFGVFEIKNDLIELDNERHFIVQNDLSISCDITEFYDEERRLVGDDLFFGYGFDEGADRGCYDLENSAGEVIARLPEGAEFMGNYIFYDGDIYDLDMRLSIDCGDADGYYMYHLGYEFMLLYKLSDDPDRETGIVYYFYNPDINDAPVEFDEEVHFYRAEEPFFEIGYIERTESGARIVYEILNARYESVLQSRTIIECAEYIEGKSWIITLKNGEVYCTN